MEVVDSEGALLTAMIEAMADPPGEATVEPIEVMIEDSYPASQLVVTFKCPKKGPALFGYRVPIWSADCPLDELGVEAFVTSVWLDIHESVMTDVGIPGQPASGGTAWIRTDL